MRKVPSGSHTVKGIDVSHYQPNINWAEVNRSGIEFAFIKATEGDHYVDKLFPSHWGMSAFAGLKRGAYHFFHPSKDPIEQAKLFCSTVGTLRPDDLPCVMDWETTDNIPDTVDMRRGLKFLDTVKALTGKNPIIYGSPYFLSHLKLPGVFGTFPLWVAHYGTSAPLVPGPWGSWMFWQHTDHGNIQGINSGVDVNLFNGNLEKLRNFVN